MTPADVEACGFDPPDPATAFCCAVTRQVFEYLLGELHHGKWAHRPAINTIATGPCGSAPKCRAWSSSLAAGTPRQRRPSAGRILFAGSTLGPGRRGRRCWTIPSTVKIPSSALDCQAARLAAVRIGKTLPWAQPRSDPVADRTGVCFRDGWQRGHRRLVVIISPDPRVKAPSPGATSSRRADATWRSPQIFNTLLPAPGGDDRTSSFLLQRSGGRPDLT